MLKQLQHMFLVFAVAALALGGVAFLPLESTPATSKDVALSVTPPVEEKVQSGETASSQVAEALAAEPVVAGLPAVFTAPISQARQRVSKKPFGLEIAPGHSPVENDRFSGFHVGVDFEVFDHEKDADVAVYAVCDGPLTLKGFAKGYGGVAVQECQLDGQSVSVIYGHLRESSIEPGFKEMLRAGQTIAVLGTGYSEETDGVRKHLHMGIRVGDASDIRGYVKDPVEMAQWRDILSYISQ